MGGGLLETNNQLERFTKNKRHRKLTYSIIGILLIIGCITLFKTFAFFEEKREFNVLKGRIPEFSQEDIQLSYTIDGIKGEIFPSKDSSIVGKGVTCSNGVTAIWNNERWSIEAINSNGQKKVICTIEFITKPKMNLFENANVGQYISYTPITINYEITSDLTGYTLIQRINPSELNLWRVIRKNEDGSIDLISEYTSSTRIFFKGKEGYKNYIGALNRIAKQYETENVTIGSRYLGYNGQTEFITDESNLNSTTDHSYGIDLNLILALGEDNLKTTKINEKNVQAEYWIASRLATFYDNGNFILDIRYLNYDINKEANASMCVSYGDMNSERGYYLRPIVTLKPNVQASGEGTYENPWKIN